MAGTRRKRGLRATAKGLQMLQEARQKRGNGRIAYPEIAEKVNTSEKTVQRFFNGIGIEPSIAYSIVSFFELKSEDILCTEEELVEKSIAEIENESAENSQRAQELVEKLRDSLDELRKEEEISFRAMEWLKANRNVLVKEAVEATLESSSGQRFLGLNPNNPGFEKLSRDLMTYLQVLYYSLELGTWDVIETAIRQSKFPVNFEIELYIDALKHVKEQKIVQNLSPEIAKPIISYLEYIIVALPIKL